MIRTIKTFAEIILTEEQKNLTLSAETMEVLTNALRVAKESFFGVDLPYLESEGAWSGDEEALYEAISIVKQYNGRLSGVADLKYFMYETVAEISFQICENDYRRQERLKLEETDKDTLEELNLSEEDLEKIFDANVYMESLTEIVTSWQTGHINISNSEDNYFDWMYDGENDLDNVCDTVIPQEAVGLTIKQYLTRSNDRVVILADGRVFFFYE